ncbi:MAG: CRISPR-associated endonuclease Cas2 [Bifidobacteriaceae bacterium]|jgi:CRISPR-associated protein Cas2|nr:CRISPR-associated endonuclease Cas2 [Bifidobacteriaceae bacterium]
MALTVIAAYDIPADSRRSRLAARLQRWGDRVQYSVFICRFEDHAELAKMLAEAETIIDPATDSLVIFRQCSTCWESHLSLGQEDIRPPTLYWAAL